MAAKRITRKAKIENPDVLYQKDPSKFPAKKINLLFKSQAQKEYHNIIVANRLTFCIGSTGTGKTHVATTMGLKALLEDQVEKLILIRPCVANEELGYLKGTLQEKYAPYLEPFLDILIRHVGKSYLEYLLSESVEKIVAKPLAYLRGSTFNNAFVILDEAQNCTFEQLYLFITRMGVGCNAIIDGDTRQIDLKGRSGLLDTVGLLKGDQDVGVMRFTDDDCIRDAFTKRIVKLYSTQYAI